MLLSLHPCGSGSQIATLVARKVPGNENTNGLLRQYFPQGFDLSVFSQAMLDEVAMRLSERPRTALTG